MLIELNFTVITVPMEISCCVVTQVSLLKFLELLFN